MSEVLKKYVMNSRIKVVNISKIVQNQKNESVCSMCDGITDDAACNTLNH